MTVRLYLKCSVCGKVTLLRTQIGWLDGHPIKINCGNCEILISGELIINHKKVEYKFSEFKNAASIEADKLDIKPDYYIEASGELLTKKLQEFKGDANSYLAPPFFNTLEAMGLNDYAIFKKTVIQFLCLIKNDWHKVRGINELWLSGKREYLKQELRSMLPEKQFPLNNDLELLRGVHQINLLFFLPVIEQDRFYGKITKFLFQEQGLLSKDIRKFFDLVNFFQAEGLLELYDAKIAKQFGQFVETFQFLIPALGLRYYRETSGGLFNEKGITTATFEDLKQFYIDTYEVVGELILLPIAFNNLKYRGNFETMKGRRRDVVLLRDLKSKSKGIRIEYISDSELYNRLVMPKPDNELRNAIGHNAYTYNGIEQLVTYYPGGEMNQGESRKVYLLQFAEQCLKLYFSLFNLHELVYQVRKAYFVSQGCKPVDPSVFD